MCVGTTMMELTRYPNSFTADCLLVWDVLKGLHKVHVYFIAL